MTGQPIGELYGPYDRGLFGHHHTDSTIQDNVDGLRLEDYQISRTRFEALCRRLGGRSLHAAMKDGALVTPEPIDTEFLTYISGIFGINPTTVTLLNENGFRGATLADSILQDGQSMDRLRVWVDSNHGGIINPRTLGLASLEIAREIGATHALVLPTELFDREIDGIYPSRDYLESHPAEINNSKVRNFELLQQISPELSPDGGVAYTLEEIRIEVERLAQKGKRVMIKADLSVDGMGNVSFDPEELYQVGEQEIPYSEITDPEKQRQIILGKLLEKGVPVGKTRETNLGVVVQEFLTDKIYDPSIEIYNPPHHWGVEPKVYYDCAMLIEQGGFAGSIIPDPLTIAHGLPQRERLIQYGIPPVLLERRNEYMNLIAEVERVALEFAKVKWHDGYVGINDCDIAICQRQDGSLYAKILEFNYNRETGGTGSNQIKRRLDRMTGQQGVVIARDTVIGDPNGPLSSGSILKVGEVLADRGVGFDTKRKGGGVILGYQINEMGIPKLMTIVYGRTLSEAMRYDTLLQQVVQS